jgi:hypothetical protein
MKNKNSIKKTASTAPGQGHRREQYEFAATLLIASFAGMFIIAITLVIVNALK